MKKIWTILLSLVGISHNSFAGCYNEVIENSTPDLVEYNLEYCVQSDLDEMEEMRRIYSDVSLEEKVEISLRAEQIADRLNSYGFRDVVLASNICRPCLELEKK